MKRIVEARKLFNITKESDLTELKGIYRNLMKEWHPDKFVNDEERKEEAALKSKEIIELFSSVDSDFEALRSKLSKQTIQKEELLDFIESVRTKKHFTLWQAYQELVVQCYRQY
jgi:5'-3' exonuclease